VGEKFGERGKKRKKKQKKSPGPYFFFDHSAHLLTIFDHTLRASGSNANGARTKVFEEKGKKKEEETDHRGNSFFLLGQLATPPIEILSLMREL
jgi:hypothetical protein